MFHSFYRVFWGCFEGVLRVFLGVLLRVISKTFIEVRLLGYFLSMLIWGVLGG